MSGGDGVYTLLVEGATSDTGSGVMSPSALGSDTSMERMSPDFSRRFSERRSSECSSSVVPQSRQMTNWLSCG